MSHQLFLNGLIAGSIYALIALGFTVNYKTVRFFHFAHGMNSVNGFLSWGGIEVIKEIEKYKPEKNGQQAIDHRI